MGLPPSEAMLHRRLLASLPASGAISLLLI
jgi:hypothetical protein